MKVVQLITGSASFGGAEAHVRDLAIGLRARGHDCVVMMGPPEGLLSEQLRLNGIPMQVVPALRKPIHPIRDLMSLFQIVSALRRFGPDIIAAHTAKAGFIGRIAAKWIGVRCFFTPHGLSFIDRQTGSLIRLRLILEQLASHLGGRMITVCDAERKLALQHLRIPPKEISTIHHGLPDCELSSPRRIGAVIITMVARFDRQKDQETLLRALSTLRHLDWELRLGGTGPLLPSVRNLAEVCGLSSRIHFLHECSEISRLLAESDIFALITNWEAFPISILEAMRAGLPVVATDTGGVCEAVQDGVNGFLVPRCGASELAERMELLIMSPDLRRRLGSQSRIRFSHHFDWRSMLDKTETVYLEGLPNRVRAGASSLAAD